MPQYTVQDPETGRTVTLEGDSAPTERELVKVFNQLKTPKEKALDIAGDVAAEFGTAVGGQMLGAETGPGYLAIAPASAAYGTYLRQKRQIERGEREDYSPWEMVTSGVLNLIPASSFIRGEATMGRYLARTAAAGGVIGGAPEAVKVAEKATEEKRWPTLDEYYSVAQKATEGAMISSAGGLAFEKASALSPAAKKLWSRLAGKTQEEANQVIREVAQTGTQAEQAAAGEIVDTVGQQLGIVRPSAAKSAEESAAVMGVVPTKSARESASVLAEAPLTQAEAESRRVGTLQPKSAEESAAVMGLQPAKSARESAEVLAQAASPAEQSAVVFQRALAEGQSPQAAAAIRDRFMAEQAVSQANVQRARQFQQARAEELQQSMRGQQLAGPESTVLENQGAQAQMHVLDTRPGAAVRERERLRQRMGINQEDLPTSEDVLNEMASLRGIGSKQKAKKFMEGGSTNAGVMAGVGAVGLAGLAATDLQAKPDTIIVRTPAGEFKYDPSQMTLDDIQKDAAKKVDEWKKIQAAAPHLDNRANYENAPDDKKLETLLSWTNSRQVVGEATKAAIQAAGSRLPMGLRPLVGVGGEMARGYIAGQTPTTGQLAESGISSLARGGTSFGPNVLQFAGTNVAGALARGAIDKEDIDFRKVAEAAAKGGLQAAAVQTVMNSPAARGETRRQQANRGDIEVFNDANRLRIVVDPAASTNPTKGQEFAVKLAGGSPRFSLDGSRANVPVVTNHFQRIAGTTGNPDLDQNLSPAFFRARLAQEGRVYDGVASLPGMRQVVEDWKQANFNSARQYRLYNENANPDNLAAARQFRTEADNLFGRIEQAAERNGQRGLVDNLRTARVRIAELHAIENAVNPADFKPDAVQALGQMYRDNPRYFTGDLGAIARIAAAQPQMFQNVRMRGTKAFSWDDLGQVPALRAFLQTGPGQRSIGNTGLDPTFLAQFARYGTGAAAQNVMQPTK